MVTKYFLDMEFIETGNKHPIVPLSIGIVCDDGREYYAVFTVTAKELRLADEWVEQNVIKHIDFSTAKSLPTIKKELIKFFGKDNFDVFGYYADYDWVLFCSIFGRMVDLPENFPKFCMDIKQIAVEKGNPELPELPGKIEHHSLWDAREMKYRYYGLTNNLI